MQTRTVLITAVVLAVMVAGAYAAGVPAPESNPSEPPVMPLTLLYPQSVSAVPVLALLDSYAGEYLGSFFTDHPQALARLINGSVDVLATGFSVGLARFQSAGDLVHLMTPVWGVSALMASRPIDAIQELAGGVVYAPFQGSPIDIYLKAVFAEAGIADQVELAYAPFPQAAALVAQGTADAAVLVEPIASRLEQAGQAYRVENLHEGWARISAGEPRSPQVSLFAAGESAQHHHDSLALLTERLETIVQDVIADPRGYAERYAQVLGFPVPVVEQALTNTLFSTPSPAETQRIIAQYARIMELAPPGPDFYAELE